MIENYANTVYVRTDRMIHVIGLSHVVKEVAQLYRSISALREHHSLSCLTVLAFPSPLFRKHYWNEASRVQKCVNLTIPEEDKAVVANGLSHV